MRKIIIGGLAIGGKLGKEDSLRFLESSTNLGIRDIDTGSLYGNGNSENLISSFNRNSSIKLKIHTKIGLIKKELKNKSFGVDLSLLTPKYIKDSSKKALKKFKSEKIERISLHGFCNKVPIDDQVGVLSELIKDGFINSYGICNFEENELKKWIETCSKNNLIMPSALDVNFNILEQKAKIKIFPLLNSHSIKAIPYRVFCRGILAGRYLKKDLIPKESRAIYSWRVKRFITEKNIMTVKKLSEIAKINNLSLLELVLHWTFSFDLIDSICLGTSSISQLKEIVKANSIDLNNSINTKDLIKNIIDDEIVNNQPKTFFEK